MIWIVVAPDLLARRYSPAFFCQYLRLKHLFICFLSLKLEHVDELEHNICWQICWNGSRGTHLIHHYVQPAASLLLTLFITRPKKISSQDGSRGLASCLRLLFSVGQFWQDSSRLHQEQLSSTDTTSSPTWTASESTWECARSTTSCSMSERI